MAQPEFDPLKSFRDLKVELDDLADDLGLAQLPSRSPLQLVPTRIPERVGIVGLGQVGGMLRESFAQLPSVSMMGVVRNRRLRDEGQDGMEVYTQTEAMLVRKPEVLFLATPNPIDESLKQIAEHAQSPLTLVLLQNGVGATAVAQKILENSRHKITLIRASLYTPVSYGQEGELVYDHKKKRVAIAPVKKEGEEPNDSLIRTENLLLAAGFDVRVESDHGLLEWTKVFANGVGATAAITDLSPAETLLDPEVSDAEFAAVQERLRILRKAGKKPLNLWGIRQLRLLARVPRFVVRDRGILGETFRGFIAKKFAKERNNQPPAAARQITQGLPIESTKAYHRPFIDLGEKYDMETPTDWAIQEIQKRHADPEDPFSLNSLSISQRRNLLLEIVNLGREEVFVKEASFLGTKFNHQKFLANLIFGVLSGGLTVLGRENLARLFDTFAKGLDALFESPHTSNADHLAFVWAIRRGLKEVTPEYKDIPIFIVAGRKFGKEKLSGLFKRVYDHPVFVTRTKEDSKDDTWKAKIWNARAGKRFKKELKGPNGERRANIIVLYPEGGRNQSPNELVLQSPSLNSSFWLLDRGIAEVVPTVMNEGPARMLPYGANIPRFAGGIEVKFGQPISTTELRKRARQVPKEPKEIYDERMDEALQGQVIYPEIEKMLPENRRRRTY